MSRPDDWEEIQQKFRILAFQRGPTRIAREIPASRRSVYNWANGETKPNRTARDRIREIVEDG